MPYVYKRLYIEVQPSDAQPGFLAPILLGSPVLPLLNDQNEQRQVRGLPGGAAPALPGNTIENPIDVDMWENLEISTDARPGDTVENPIILDDSGADNSCTYVPTRSLTSSTGNVGNALVYGDITNDDHSVEEYYECKICFCKIIDLVLGCGHPYCYSCFNSFFHEVALRTTDHDEEAARELLATQSLEPYCPFCQKTLAGRYSRAGELHHLNGCLVSLECPSSHQECFLKNYIVQGIRIRPL